MKSCRTRNAWRPAWPGTIALGAWCLCLPAVRAEEVDEVTANKPVTPTLSAAENPLLAEVPRLAPVAAAEPAELEASIDRGIKFLLEDQNADGSWGSAHHTKALNIYAPVPGAHHAFRTAVTAMCISALIETGRTDAETIASLERGEQWLLDQLLRLRRATPDALYNIWGHAYAISALVKMYDRVPGNEVRREQIRGLIASQLDYLDRFESVDGGWGYYDFRTGSKKPGTDATSFQTATVLIAMHEARQIGVEPKQRTVDRGIAAILRQQKPDFSYLYGEYLKWVPMHPVNRPGGSLGRSQACNAALRFWKDQSVTDQVISVWLDRLFARNGWLSIGRKRPIPHESWFAVAGYFYYYGHYYGAMCIDLLPAEQRQEYRNHMSKLMLELQEKDGSWWDYPLYNYHQQYGTAFALMTLVRCRSEAKS